MRESGRNRVNIRHAPVRLTDMRKRRDRAMKRAAFFIAATIAAVILAGVSPARAQEGEGPDGGFSAYAVARVKVLDGSVWVRPSDGGDWEEYMSNSPVPPRSRVSDPEGTDAELE